MCSIQEGGDLAPEKKVSSSERRNCMKCENAAVVVIRINDPLCKECFLQYCTHKFRSAFGKSKLIRDGEKVLFAFSGGNCCTAMLNLVQEGLSIKAHKKLRFTPTLVYIDEGSTVGQSPTDRQHTTQQVVAGMKECGFQFCTTVLEQSLEDQPKVKIYQAGEDENLEKQLESLRLDAEISTKFEKLLASAKSLTAKEQLLHTLKQKLLVAVAKQLNMTKVLLGDSATKLAVRLLSNVTQGRGAHVPYELSFADNRFGDIVLVRPLREFANKEIVMYNHVNHLHPMVQESVTTKTPSNASLNRLTEEFVIGLQAEYPTTVSTIFRTGEKMDLADKKDEPEEKCCMCHAPLDTSVGPSSALSATLFSQYLSQKKKEEPDTSPQLQVGSCGDTNTGHAKETSNENEGTQPASGTCDSGVGTSCGTSGTKTECCGEGDGSCQTRKQGFNQEELLNAVCYGCRLVLRDMKDISSLPSSILEEAGQKIRRNQLKTSIQDFLLDPTES